MRPSPAVRPRVLLAAAAAAAVVLSACGSEEAAPPPKQPVEGGPELAAVWPLTGEPADGDTPEHPVLVVKVDNSENSAPQVGLGNADMVTEELVEGGTTRLAAMYYQQELPEEVGPVRSMRATDIGIVKPALGVILASGGAPDTIQRLVQDEIPTRVEGEGPGWSRDSGRFAPYDLVLDLRSAAAELEDLATVPTSYLPWGSADDLPPGQPATTFDAVFSPAHTTSWTYSDDGTYVNEASLAAEDDRFRPDSVLVLRTEQTDAGYLDPAGFTVPESIYTGTGEAVLFHGGQMVEATWQKGSTGQPLRLETAAGEALEVPAGRVWIELLPRNADGGRVDVG